MERENFSESMYMFEFTLFKISELIGIKALDNLLTSIGFIFEKHGLESLKIFDKLESLTFGYPSNKIIAALERESRLLFTKTGKHKTKSGGRPNKTNELINTIIYHKKEYSKAQYNKTRDLHSIDLKEKIIIFLEKISKATRYKFLELIKENDLEEFYATIILFEPPKMNDAYFMDS